jgi:hypothetical protein
MITIQSEDKNQNEIVQSFNETLEFLQQEQVETIPLCYDAPGTTKVHCQSMFDWVCQGFLCRYLNLAKAFSTHVNQRDALPAAMLGRGLLETVAHFHNLLSKIQSHLNLKNWDHVYHYIASYALGGKHGFKPDNLPDQKLKALHINDSLETIDKTYKNVGRSHDWLCEFVHPNALGTTLGFSQVDKKNGSVLFHKNIPFERGSSPILEAAVWLPVFQDDWEKRLEIRKKIMSDWEPNVSVCDLFEGKRS